jgi:HK97 family phage major capsid protein
VRALSVRDGNKRPLFMTALEAPAAGGIGSILGYPVVPASAAPTTNAASAKVAAFGDPQGQVVGIRNDFEFAASEHHRFDYDQIAYRGLARFGNKIRSATAFAVLTLPAQ